MCTGPRDPRDAYDMANAALDLAHGHLEVDFDALDAEQRHAYVQDARCALYTTCDELYRTGSLRAPVLLVRSLLSLRLGSPSRTDTAFCPPRSTDSSSLCVQGGDAALAVARAAHTAVRTRQPLTRCASRPYTLSLKALPLILALYLAVSSLKTLLEPALRPLARARGRMAPGNFGADGEEARRDDGARVGGWGATEMGVGRCRVCWAGAAVVLARRRRARRRFVREPGSRRAERLSVSGFRALRGRFTAAKAAH